MLDANKRATLQTPQTAEAFKCSQCNDSDNGLLATMWVLQFGTAANPMEFQRKHRQLSRNFIA